MNLDELRTAIGRGDRLSYLDSLELIKRARRLTAAERLIKAQHDAMQGMVVYSKRGGHRVSRARARAWYTKYREEYPADE